MSSQTLADSTTTTIPTAGFVKLYVGILIGAGVLVFALYWALETFFSYDGSSGNGMGLILPAIAGMSAAGGWYNKHKTRPGSGQMWKLALICGLITALINLAILVVLYQTGLLQEALGGQPLTRQEMQIFAAVLAGVAVLQVLMVRMGMWFGFRSAVKQAQKLAQKLAAKEAAK
ncbi:ABZJ_00895 family protein [Paracoccus sp. (in: a-proteobacteria)]|uniref:ABZJ_00895 family protein n=1 Tax=Paracoccus sp. TaxID=267 RepID=UPI0035B3288C